jgi:hypothetical protein
MKKLLAISWAMPPMLYPRSIQVSRILAALAKLGWEITVICNDPQNSSQNDVTLSALYDDYYRKVNVLPDSFKKADPLMSTWLEAPIRAARAEIRSNQYSVLVSFAQPWVDHLIGLELHKETDIPWIAHFSDPWVDSVYYSGTDGKQLKEWRNLERKVIHQASAVIFTNVHARDLVMSKYSPFWSRKSFIMPHTFDSELAEKLSVRPPSEDHRLHMVYTGDLYSQRTAGSLLKALNGLCKQRPLADELHIQFIGRIAASERIMAEELGLGSMVNFYEQLPYINSLQASALCDVLLLIDAPSLKPSPFLPSKLVDYLMFRKPIFGLISSRGASVDLLSRLGSVVVSPDDVASIIKALEKLLAQWRDGNLKAADNFDLVASDYSPQRVGSYFHQILSKAIDPAPIKYWWQNILPL